VHCFREDEYILLAAICSSKECGKENGSHVRRAVVDITAGSGYPPPDEYPAEEVERVKSRGHWASDGEGYL
jgi:hypothetical protein